MRLQGRDGRDREATRQGQEGQGGFKAGRLQDRVATRQGREAQGDFKAGTGGVEARDAEWNIILMRHRAETPLDLNELHLCKCKLSRADFKIQKFAYSYSCTVSSSERRIAVILIP